MKFVQKVRVKLEKCGRVQENSIISNAKDAAEIAYKFIDSSDREILGVMCLNTKNEVVNICMVSMGSLNSSIAHPREIFKTAILSNAKSIIIFHNHPSGNCEASRQDIQVSKRIKEAGFILGIELLDSIIIGTSIEEDKYLSLKQQDII